MISHPDNLLPSASNTWLFAITYFDLSKPSEYIFPCSILIFSILIRVFVTNGCPLLPPRPPISNLFPLIRFLPITSTLILPPSPAFTIGTGFSTLGVPSCVLFPNTLSPRNCLSELSVRVTVSPCAVSTMASALFCCKDSTPALFAAICSLSATIPAAASCTLPTCVSPSVVTACTAVVLAVSTSLTACVPACCTAVVCFCPSSETAPTAASWACPTAVSAF